MSSTTTIRVATARDALELTALAHRAKASWGYPGEWLAVWNAELTLTGEYLTRHHSLVADRDGHAVGVVVLEEHAGHWALEHVWVDPVSQRSGVGRALVEHALRVAWATRRQPVRVVSDPNAESFYLRFGGIRVGERPAPMPGAPDRVLPVLEFSAP